MNFFKKERLTIRQRPIETRKLLRPFIKKYGSPVIAHAIHDKKTFKQILIDGELKLPKKHDFDKKTPYMEKFLGVDNALYYSLGFVYKTAYDWKYNLIFGFDFLKELRYYSKPVFYMCYLKIVQYWYKDDFDYLIKLKNKNRKTKEVVSKFLNESYKGEVGKMFDFWKIEKETFEHIQKYPNKKALIKIIKKTERKLRVKYPNSKKDAKNSIAEDRSPELISTKKNNLIKDPYFLGFYIDGKIPLDILRLLKKKYPDKILFDGNKIKEIKDLR